MNARPPGRPLRSNGFTLDAGPDRLGRLAPSDLSHGMAEHRARFAADGYLWLKGFLPRADVLDFRGHFLAQFADTGLLAPGSDPREGIYGGDRGYDAELARRRLMELVRSAAYESFCLHPRLWRFLDAFVGGPSYLHKRKLIRYTRPGDAAATGAHYDLTYLRAGTDKLVTAWIPVGDVPIEMGGLVYLEGSDKFGRTMEAKFAQANAHLSHDDRISAFNAVMNDGGWISKDLPGLAERLGSRWLVADYEAGDVVLHSPYMIHAATCNDDSAGRLRLSTDIRYQNVRDEIDARWTNHWSLDDML
jgi:ectoine hydroxylase-related dioxygenase (phytanoyl-CoA dioxygenase family)